jgi:hypothetical protein
MKHPITLDNKLDELGIALDYWRWKYLVSHPFFKAEYYNKYEKAKKEFSNYYKSKYPKAKIKANESKDYIRLDDLTEKFEEYEN